MIFLYPLIIIILQMKKKVILILIAVMALFGAGASVAACGVKATAQGQWDLLNCTDGEGNVLASGGYELGSANAETLKMSCEVSASRFVLRHNGNVYYGDYTEKREDGEIFVYVTMDEGGEFTARCYLDKSSESKIQLMEIVYNERIYTFRKIA